MVTDYKKVTIRQSVMGSQPPILPVSKNVLDQRGKRFRQNVQKQMNQVRKQESDRMAQEFGSHPGKPMGYK